MRRGDKGPWGQKAPQGTRLEGPIDQGGLLPFLGCPRGVWGLAGAQGRGTLTSLSASLACWHQSRTNPKPAPGKDKSLLAPAAAPGAWEGRSGEADVGPPKAGAVDVCS